MGSSPGMRWASGGVSVMTALSVNLNKIALVRNSRGGTLPSVTRAAKICLDAGADGITVHPRPDQRHIRPHDVHDLKAMLNDVELNIEGNPFEESFHSLVLAAKPAQCTLVPDSRQQLTSDHGWNFAADGARLAPQIREYHAAGIRVSLFVDPDPQAMVAAKELGADRVELYTGPYAHDYVTANRSASLVTYAEAAVAAHSAGLGINAGHDLNRENLGAFLDVVPRVDEVSIGHALIVDALELGLTETVRQYAAICHASR